MKITLRMTGLAARYLPPGSTGSLTDMVIPDGTTVGALMRQLGLPGEDSYLVIVSDVAVPLAKRPSHRLVEGDMIAIVPPLKGG